MIKSLDEKLADIHRDPHGSDAFILADAKDADMAFGVRAPGPSRDSKASYCESVGCWKSLEDYRQQIREVIHQGLVDIMLLSASNVERLAMQEGLFRDSKITPAARANDTSDIWAVRGGSYPNHPSRSFRTATLDHIRYGELTEDFSKPTIGADLGLYSITFTNNLEYDHQSLEQFHAFRLEAEKKNFRYFLEVFNPNVDPGIAHRDVSGFLNDHIVRALAGVTSKGRPVFLKIPYHGPQALEELVSYDPHLVVGIMGGSAGTTYDAFKMIHDCKKYGGRAALYGRKINLSEHPLTFIEMLNRIIAGEISPEEAVKAYHGVLQQLGIKPLRPLRKDMELTKTVMSYR